MRPVIHRRHEATIGRVVDVLLPPGHRRYQLRSNPGGELTRRITAQSHFQVVMRVVSGADVLIDEGRRIDVAHHQIELAVVVEIRVRRSVRETRLIHPPGAGHVGEGQIAVVAEHVVRESVSGEILQQPARARFVASLRRPEQRVHVIQIVDRFRVAIADEDVLVAIVVEVGEESAPAPVGV